ncbi:MAG: hypothetical protein O2960_24800 [Verrucomicrobia bacterium]|nr:hypothetical protein [Verrucomicrobiota bacterium]
MADQPLQSAVTDRTISITPAQASRLDAAAHSGQSRADQFSQKQQTQIMPTPEDQANFDREFSKARQQDLGSDSFNGTRQDGDAPSGTKVDPADDPHFKKPVSDAAALPAEDKPKASSVPGLPEWKPKTNEASKHWEEMKTRHSQEVAQIKSDTDKLKAELQAARAAGDSEEVKKIKDELSQYREIIRDVAIERDPDFKQRYSARQDAAISAAKLAAGDAAPQLEALLKAPSGPWRDEQINSLIEDLPASSQRRVGAALGVLDQIDIERDTEIASRRTQFDQKQSALMTQQQRQQEQRTRELTGAFESTLKEWTDNKNGNPFFVEKDGDTEHNAAVRESIELSKSIFNGQLQPDELSRAALWAAMGPRALEGWQIAIARAEKAERMLDKIRGVQPGSGRGGSATEMPAQGDAPKAGTAQYDDYMRRGIQAAQMADRQRG